MSRESNVDGKPNPMTPPPSYEEAIAMPRHPNPTSAYPSAAYPGPVYPSGAYPGAAYPTGAYPGAAYPTGAYPGAAYPTGAYPGAAYPTGAYPGAAYPTSAYPGSAYPTGAYPGSVYPMPPAAYTYAATSGGSAGVGSTTAAVPVAVAPPTVPPAVEGSGEPYDSETPPACPPAVVEPSLASAGLYPTLEAKVAEEPTATGALTFTPYEMMLRMGRSNTMVQCIFDNPAKAQQFISDNKLTSENPKRKGELKMVDARTFKRLGLFVVRLGKPHYDTLRATFVDLPPFSDVRDLPQLPALKITSKVRFYTALQAQLFQGGSGWIHFVFQTQRNAAQFIAKHELTSEDPSPARRGKPKSINTRRYPGRYMVLVGRESYARLRDQYAATGEAQDKLPSFSASTRMHRK